VTEKKTTPTKKASYPINPIKKVSYEPKDGMDVPRFCEKDLLAILGTAEPSRGMAPYTDDNFEIWGVAVAITYPDVKRLDLQFEMHTEGYWEHEDVKKRLLEATVPIYMQEQHDDIPQSIQFPIEILNKYRKYFTSSIAYMLALAYHSFVMTKNPKHVALFGVSMLGDEEYSIQRPCCEYWLGRMEGVGIDVEIAPGGAVLASSGLYAYENYMAVCYDITQRIAGLQMGFNHSVKELEKWKEQKAKQEGAVAESGYWLRRLQRGEK